VLIDELRAARSTFEKACTATGVDAVGLRNMLAGLQRLVAEFQTVQQDSGTDEATR
jgi:hypothetical protein